MNDAGNDHVTPLTDSVISSERLEALEKMSSGVTHYFNNVLMPILGGADYLLQHPDALDDRDELLEVIESIKTVTLNARESLMKLNQFYRGTTDAIKESINIENLVEDIDFCSSEVWRKTVEEKNIPVSLKTDIQVSNNVSAVESELRWLILSLLENAVESMPEGGEILLSVVCVDKRNLEIKISDNGIGMNDEARKKCLEPFFSTKLAHVGLGLSLVYGVASRHSGRMDITSFDGKGTTVKVLLPIAEG